jgi:hypothetical protein
LNAGFLRYPAPWIIVACALVIFLLTTARGLAVSLRGDDRRLRMAVIGTGLFALVQLCAIYGTDYYQPRSGAQGRFLFPAIGPFAALAAVGVAHWKALPTSRAVFVVAVGALAICDLAAWATTLIPAYAY